MARNSVKKPDFLLFISRKQLELRRESEQVEMRVYPPATFEYGEIRDHTVWTELLMELCGRVVGLRGVAIIAKDLVYERPISTDEDVEKYRILTPYSEVAVMQADGQEKDSRVVFTTNRQVGDTASNIVNQMGGELVSILPAQLVGGAESLEQLVTDQVTPISPSFLTVRKREGIELEVGKNWGPGRKTLLVLFMLVSMAIAAVLTIYVFRPSPKPFVQLPADISELTRSAQFTSQADLKTERDQIEIEIQEVTISSSSAQLYEAALVRGGYSNITVTATASSQLERTITFSPVVSPELQEDLSVLLQLLGDPFTLTTASEAAVADVVIHL